MRHLKKISGLALASLVLSLTGTAATAVSTSYTQDFDSLGTALPDGWEVWTSSTATGNGSAFPWSTAPVANNASGTASSYFRNLPGASQSWTASLSSGTDRALGWRGDSSASRDGSITFTFSNTSGWHFGSMRFDLFTPNSAGSMASFSLEYQVGSSGTFSSLAGKSYTTDTAQSPLTITSVTLTSVELSPLNNQSEQVTLRLNNTASSGTSWNSLALDNFTYSASAIPEPSAYAFLAGMGGLVLAALRRRRTHPATSAT
jgi:hypothetical protein